MSRFAKNILLIAGAFYCSSSVALAAKGGVSPSAYELFNIFGVPVTNSMVTCWAISILLIGAIQFFVGRPKRIPSRAQLVFEQLIVGVRELAEPIVGARVTPKVFPLLMGFFMFILIMNWSGLLPGVGAFGYDELIAQVSAEQAELLKAEGVRIVERDGHFYKSHLKYFFRPSNADLNTTLALSIISFVAWVWCVLRYAGPRVLLRDLFGNKADKSETPIPLYLFLFFVFLGVGLIEVISILSRLISLSFRLYGNVFGGESLLSSMQGIVAYILPVPFYFLEMLIGFVQALVFMLLTAVYIGLVTNHEGGEDQPH